LYTLRKSFIARKAGPIRSIRPRGSLQITSSFEATLVREVESATVREGDDDASQSCGSAGRCRRQACEQLPTPTPTMTRAARRLLLRRLRLMHRSRRRHRSGWQSRRRRRKSPLPPQAAPAAQPPTRRRRCRARSDAAKRHADAADRFQQPDRRRHRMGASRRAASDAPKPARRPRPGTPAKSTPEPSESGR
jgi:hypothetical protein